MTQPVQNLYGSGNLRAIWNGRSVNHNDRVSKRPRGGDFGVSTSTACVFGHDDVNAMSLHQGLIVGLRERPPRHQNMRVRQRQGVFGRVHQTQKVEVLWVRREFRQMHTPHGQHHALSRLVKGSHGTRDIAHMGPGVAVLRNPRGPSQSQQRHVSARAGLNRIAAHLGCERMRGVDHVGDGMVEQIGAQTVYAAKPADPLGQRLAHGSFHPTREGNGAVDTRVRHGSSQGRRLKRAAKDQEVDGHA